LDGLDEEEVVEEIDRAEVAEEAKEAMVQVILAPSTPPSRRAGHII